MAFDPNPAAAHLASLRDAGEAVSRLGDDIRPRDVAEAVAVQVAYAQRLGEVPPAGFKIGATARRMQDYLGLTGPAAGFMANTGLHRSGVALPFAQFLAAGVECELAVRLGAPLPPGPCTRAAAGAAVSEMFAAIEIVESRYGPPPAGDLAAIGTPTLIADRVYHAAAVLGASGPWHAIDLETVAGTIAVDGVEQASGVGGDLLGHPLEALAWLARSAEAAVFGGLRVGQVIMLGSVTPPIWLARPCVVAVSFAGFEPVTLQLI